MNNKYEQGARPIKSKAIAAHYNNKHPVVSLDDYAKIWRDWINFSDNKQIHGLADFQRAHYTQGTTQTFDQFNIRNNGNILALTGEFQYHRCIGKFSNFTEDLGVTLSEDSKYGFVHSVPFSDYGYVHSDFNTLMVLCEEMGVPVCLDFAYWGIGKDTVIDLTDYPCVKEITFSLSKPFFTLETHRVGIRFSRDYIDDGISMLNEVGMVNKHSMALGASYMNKFSPDWNWNTFGSKYKEVTTKENLVTTNTVIFGMGNKARHAEYNRGIKDNHRICISSMLGDLNES